MQLDYAPKHYQEATWWEEESRGRIKCTLCPRYCKIPRGSHGFCYVRQNIDGTLYSSAYGKSTDFAVDPIEKKPLYHYYPGSNILSFGTIGCNLGCKFCQNWSISKIRDEDRLKNKITPGEIINLAKDRKCIGIAYTYNDPIVFAEWVIDIAEVAREANLKNVLVTNGYITPEARSNLFRHIDAVNVDLKSFSDTFYKKLTLSRINPVIDTLRWLINESDVWVEITNLIIPGKNDSTSEIDRLTSFIAKELSTNTPLHFSAFHPDFKMLDIPTTPLMTLEKACSIARKNGLVHVYYGNVPLSLQNYTYCPNCEEAVIERDYYMITNSHLNGNNCGNCGQPIPGVFS